MSPASKRALVIGSISRDYNLNDSLALEGRPGGVVHHAGLALAELGADVRVVTRLHLKDEELVSPLRGQGVEVHALSSSATTTYRNDYSSAGDRHLLQSKSDPITHADIPENWRQADLIQLGPLHPRDVSIDVARILRGFVGLDAQGLARENEGDARVTLQQYARYLDVVQISEADLPYFLRNEGPEELAKQLPIPELIVTHGRRGATVLVEGKAQQVSASAVEDGDFVGAGDVFLACYLLARTKGLPPREAATGATRACAERISSGKIPAGFSLEAPPS